jgi:ABC-2 type transport system ATP-binding protein
MIEAQHLTKRYGHTVTVDEATFVVRPGRVTGFLGPNGAGQRIFAGQHAQVGISHPGVVQAMVFGALAAASLRA